MLETQANQPLYSKVLWNRPISRATAGRLLLVGGHRHNVSLLQNTYQLAQACGIGAMTLLVPDALRALLGTVPEITFAPSTQSGSLAKLGLDQLQELSSHADATLVGPNLSNNSETAIIIEKFIETYQQSLILADDALELMANVPDLFRSRPKTLLVLSMQQLFRLAGKLGLPLTIRPEAGIGGKVDIVRELFDTIRVDIVLVGPELIVMTAEQTSVTAISQQLPTLAAAAYGAMSVFYTQNPSNRYQGLTTAAYVIQQSLERLETATQSGLTKAIASVIAESETS